MGGFGSGRKAFRATCEEAKRLDIRWLRKRGYLQPGTFATLTFSWNDQPSGSISYIAHHAMVKVAYRYKDYSDADWTDVTEDIRLNSSHCHFGGLRRWFTCPRCYRRCQVLYMRSNRFQCRKCARVFYQCQSETWAWRADRQYRKLNALLDPECIGGDSWQKPMGMHWKTFNRLVARANRYGSVSDFGFFSCIESILNRQRKT